MADLVVGFIKEADLTNIPVINGQICFKEDYDNDTATMYLDTKYKGAGEDEEHYHRIPVNKYILTEDDKEEIAGKASPKYYKHNIRLTYTSSNVAIKCFLSVLNDTETALTIADLKLYMQDNNYAYTGEQSGSDVSELMASGYYNLIDDNEDSNILTIDSIQYEYGVDTENDDEEIARINFNVHSSDSLVTGTQDFSDITLDDNVVPCFSEEEE